MNKSDFLLLICYLEGFKTKFRELHWNAKLKSEHVLCDEIMDSIINFQDNFAEEGFTFFKKFNQGEFIPELNYSQTTISALNELLALLMENKILLIKNIEFCSLSALVDEMIHKVRKFITLTTYK